MGRNWYQTIGIAFAATLAQIISNVERIGEALKMVCGAYQFAETWY